MSSQYKISEYELLRLQRIKRNEDRMKELGLDQNLFMKVKPKKQEIISKIKRSIPGQEKRSRRFNLRKKRVLDYREDDGEEQRRPRSLKIGVEKSKLSEQDRKPLASVDDIVMAKFEEFLDYENCISHQNKRSVMRQARKLFSGEGIRYKSPQYGWPEGCYFKKGVKITPMSDFAELMIEGQACEDKWGRDHGNGWLIKHPLTKLLLFKQFILDNPDFLTSELRLFKMATDIDLVDDKTVNNQTFPDVLFPVADVDPAAYNFNDDSTADVNPVRDVVVPNSSPAADFYQAADVPSKADEEVDPAAAVSQAENVDRVPNALPRQNSLAIAQSVSEVAETNKSNKIKDDGDVIQNGQSTTAASEAETRME